MTCVCKNILSVKHILLDCPIIRVISEKMDVRDFFYNTDVITNIVKSNVHSPVGKLV